MFKEEDIRLMRFLVAKGVLDKPGAEKFQRTMNTADVKLCDDVLIDLCGVHEEALSSAISQEFNIPFVNLTESFVTLSDKQLKEDFLKKYNALPIIRGGVELTVVFTSPPYKDVIDAMRRETKAFIVPVVAKRSACQAIMNGTDERKRNNYQFLQSKFQIENIDLNTRPKDKVYEIFHSGRLPNADILVDEIMIRAIKDGATDIYFEPMETAFRIRFSIDSVLHQFISLPKEMAEPLCNVMRTRGSLNMFDKKKAQDGRYSTQYANFLFDFRVNTLPTIEGERFSIRITPKGSSILDLDEVGFSPESSVLVNHLLNRPRGMLIIAGPSGSGKSSTAYACLKSFRDSMKNIMSVENPVEFRLDFASQVEVDPDQKMDFGSSMRAILKQHPDIIFLGEIRDPDAGRAASEAALTGIMVVSTILSSDALSTIPRLVNFDVPPSWLAQTLNGIIFQQLARRVCKHCKESYTPTEQMLSTAGLTQLEGAIVLFRGKGCDHCGGDGYLGRTAIHEVLVIDEELKDLIYSQASPVKLKEAASKKGFESIRFDAAKKLVSGIISLEEYLRVLG